MAAQPLIFVNYRVDDEPFGAVMIDQALSARFGDDAVFRASRSIPPGADFSQILLDAVRSAQTLLVVIGPRWLLAADGQGRRRIDNPYDWVRREIALAFETDTCVIPLLLSANLPKPDTLPPDIAQLGSCQYRRIHYRSAQRDLSGLAADLRGLIPQLKTRRRGRQ